MPHVRKAGDLRRVVGDEAHVADAELLQDPRGCGVVAGVDRQAERDVRVDGVEPAVLQRVRADLVVQADAATLVTQVEDDAALLARDRLERRLQLLAAVAAQRAEHVAGQTLGVQANERRASARERPARDGDDLGAGRPVDPDAEIAEARGECSLGRYVLFYGHDDQCCRPDAALLASKLRPGRPVSEALPGWVSIRGLRCRARQGTTPEERERRATTSSTWRCMLTWAPLSRAMT